VAIFKIDGVDMPSPSDLSMGIQDISKAERNARGTIIIERIATKDKIELQWNYLTAAQLAILLNAVAPVFFTVTYTNPRSGDLRTATFYAGDRTMGYIDFQNGVPRYKDIKFNVIER
jgi:hypothetical protein